MFAYLKDTGSLQTSIERLSQLLQVKHTVLPLSEDFVTLMGKTVDGEIVNPDLGIGYYLYDIDLDIKHKGFKKEFKKETIEGIEIHIIELPKFRAKS